jgi:predicted transcriptional regulator
MEVKIHIEGEGLSFDGETTITKAAQVIAFIKAEAQSGVSVRPSFLPTIINTSTPPRQLILESGAKTNPQKIAVLGKYLLARDQHSFSAKEIQELLKKTGESLPRNFGRDLREAVRSGFIFEDQDMQGQYVLTEMGVEATERGFKVVKGLSAARSRKNGSSGKQKIKISDGVSALEITPNEAGFPEYWNLKNKGHRILWILGYAHNHQISSLIPKEIEFLATRLRDNISASGVNALTGALVKRGFVAAATKQYRILQPGISFLQNWKSETDD